MPEPHPSLVHRERLGPLQVLEIAAPSMVLAHGRLGELMREPARRAIATRLSVTPSATLERQLTGIRACRAFMEARAADAKVAAPVRSALAELLECLGAWSRPLGLEACLDGRPGLSVEDLALWAQDDNNGCQTGALRRRDGSVLLWHTEEDTIGFLDRPRLVSFSVGGEDRSAFLYPYLLPGPAFGWGVGQIHAVDSLHTRRDQPFEGTLSGVASWLVWRIGPEVPARAILLALAPFVDGCAIHVARAAEGRVSVETHEIAGRVVQTRRLGARAGAVTLQVNIVSQADGALGREQEIRPRSRVLYERRLDRMRAGIAPLSARPGEVTPDDILRMIASRRGGSYAYANADVKAHAVACVSAAGIEVHVASGRPTPATSIVPAGGSEALRQALPRLCARRISGGDHGED